MQLILPPFEEVVAVSVKMSDLIRLHQAKLPSKFLHVMHPVSLLATRCRCFSDQAQHLRQLRKLAHPAIDRGFEEDM